MLMTYSLSHTDIHGQSTMKGIPTMLMTCSLTHTDMHVQSTVKGVPMMLMTSHLESTKPHAAERKRQLQKALKHMTDSPPDRTVVFGGDFNIRDKEV